MSSSLVLSKDAQVTHTTSSGTATPDVTTVGVTAGAATPDIAQNSTNGNTTGANTTSTDSVTGTATGTVNGTAGNPAGVTDRPAAPAGATRRNGAATTAPVPPRLTTTVPAEYVHRAALAEVFLTGCEKSGPETYILTGQWPRAHTFFTTLDGRHDHLQACETLRQTGIYLAHAEHGIPLGHHFVMQDMTVTTHPEHLTIGSTPTNLTLHTTLSRPGRSPQFTITLTITNPEGQTLSTGHGHFTCISPAAYHRMRTASNPDNTTDPTTHTLKALVHTPTDQAPSL
ncbi:AfsA-related hotdog domain-containing protein, partial [Streptomyces sp. SID337]|uniref:AfsA-related hotdog domain-containing protein n=2 Tax=Streptomyces TaxID=1883 RepID=UPI0013853CD2